MKKKLFLQVIVFTITLFTFTLPVSAQKSDGVDEYRETLKRIIRFSENSSLTDDVFSNLLSVLRLNVPGKDDAYWNEFSKTWKEKTENRMFDVCIPIYKKRLALEELKEVASFFESPVGQKYKESALVTMRDSMPLLLQQVYLDMEREVIPKSNCNADVIEQKNKRDQQMYDEGYVIPRDSVEVADRIYYGGSTKPLLYSIERRKHDTKVTFLQPIYFDWQWLHFSPGFKIVDKKSGDEYVVRGYAGGAPFGRLLIVEGFNSKYIYISLLFPKLRRSVREIDIMELPHEKDVLPSNDDGVPKSYFDIKIKDYQVSSKKKNRKVYF